MFGIPTEQEIKEIKPNMFVQGWINKLVYEVMATYKEDEVILSKPFSADSKAYKNKWQHPDRISTIYELKRDFIEWIPPKEETKKPEPIKNTEPVNPYYGKDGRYWNQGD